MPETFPILLSARDRREHPDWPASVPWRLAEAVRAQAEANHGQSLERLAERGGLCPVEFVLAHNGRKLYDGAPIPSTEFAVNLIRRHLGPARPLTDGRAAAALAAIVAAGALGGRQR